MIIEFHKNFDKNYQKLTKKIQKKVDDSLLKFTQDPFYKTLKNHALRGRMQTKRAFWVTGDVRVIFEEKNNYYIVMMLNVGKHNQVY